MQKNNSFGERLETFFAGKGFYIVLFLCVAVIGVSAWVILAETGTNVDNQQAIDVMQKAEEHVAVVTAAPEKPSVVEVKDEPTAEEPKAEEEAEQTKEIETDASEPAESVAAEVVVETPLFVWPVNGEIAIVYSVDALIYNRTMRDWRTHDGIDVEAELGTHVMAMSSGTVEDIYKDDLYGTTVVISHPNGVTSLYANLAEMPTVSVGDGVSTGEVIGAVGNTALAETGEVMHLHIAMSKDGASVNPADYLPYR